MKRKKRKNRGVFLVSFLFILIIIIVLVISTTLFQKPDLPYYSIVSKYSKEYEVPIALVYAVMYTESSFREDAVSHADAKGLMQITDDTLFWVTEYHFKLKGELDIFDPELNIRVGIYYLRYAYKRYGNWDTALASYNAGFGRVDDWLLDSRFSNDGESLYYIPYKETREYVEKVNRRIPYYDSIINNISNREEISQ